MFRNALLLCLCAALSFAYRIGEFQEVDHTVFGTTHQTTYLSPALPLRPGWVIQSDADKTPMKMPTSGYITGFYAEVVDSQNRSVLLDEVYLHHWILGDSLGNGGPCRSLSYVLGVGAETRGTPINFPAGYGLPLKPEMHWMASIHVLRTTHVEDVKHCIECHCPGGDNAGGGLQCCPTTADTGISCKTFPGSPTDVKTYYLRYTVTWQPLEDNLIPLTIYNFDVANCNFQYNVPACNGGDCIDLRQASYPAKVDSDIIFLVGHMHIGGINVTFSVNDKPIYTAYPTYGNGTKAGNEKGYLVGITSEAFSTPYKMKKGDKMTLSAHYHSNVYHDGVMGLCLVAVVEKPTINVQ